MAITKLTGEEIEANLKNLPHWEVKDEKLHRELKFKDFVQAWGFMTQAAMLAEQMDHHPEWQNVWNKVIIDLTTHSAKGISRLDFELAEKMNTIADSMGV